MERKGQPELPADARLAGLGISHDASGFEVCVVPLGPERGYRRIRFRSDADS